MTASTRHMIGNIVLGVAIVMLVVQILGMAGWIPKPAPSREMTMLALVLTVAARSLRRTRPAAVMPPVQSPPAQ